MGKEDGTEFENVTKKITKTANTSVHTVFECQITSMLDYK